VIDFDVDETSEEVTGMATQTEESEYLFVSEPEKPFGDYCCINDNNKMSFYTAYVVKFPDSK